MPPKHSYKKKSPVSKNVETSRDVEGNTNSSTSKQPNQLISWFFTYNNYKEEEIEILETRFKEICKQYVFQKEIGEQGTPHLQGVIFLKRKMRYSEFNLPVQIHWEKVIDKKSAIAYCSKDDTRIPNTEPYEYPPIAKLITLKPEDLYPFQAKIEELCMIPVDQRSRDINVVYDPIGCVGKTEFCKYMFKRHKCVIFTGGQMKDVSRVLALEVKAGRNLNEHTIMYFNIPKKGYLCTRSLECVKDGLITSVKNDSCTLVFNKPHVWVFTNELPDLTKLTEDKWILWKIENNDLVRFN